jgi:hypothetical protein
MVTSDPQAEELSLATRERKSEIAVGRAKKVVVKSREPMAEVWRKYGELGQAVRAEPSGAYYCIDRAVADMMTKALETSIIKSQRRCSSWEKAATNARVERRFAQADSLDRAVEEEEKVQQAMAIIADALVYEGPGGKCPVNGLKS